MRVAKLESGRPWLIVLTLPFANTIWIDAGSEGEKHRGGFRFV